jgi:hypothetical protein
MFKLKPTARRWLDHLIADPWEYFFQYTRRDCPRLRIDNVEIDVKNLIFRKFRCATKFCAPGLRQPGGKSCCAELAASITEFERSRIAAHWPKLHKFLSARDRSFDKVQLEDCFDRDDDFLLELGKKGPAKKRKCIFALDLPDGSFHCGLHAFSLEYRMNIAALKPFTCFIFPLCLLEIGREQFVLTCYAQDTKELIGFGERPEKFGCLASQNAGNAPPLYQALGETITEIFGAPFYEKLDKAARKILNEGRRK